MPAYRLSDPVDRRIRRDPVLLAATLVWATFAAWRRAGATNLRRAARR